MKFNNINDIRLLVTTKQSLSQTDLDEIEAFFDSDRHRSDIIEFNTQDRQGRTLLHHIAAKQFDDNADAESFIRRILNLKITQEDSPFVHPNAFLYELDGNGKKGKSVLEIAQDNDKSGFVRGIEAIIMERFNRINDFLVNLKTKKGKPRLFKNAEEKKQEDEYINQHTELAYYYWENGIDPQSRINKLKQPQGLGKDTQAEFDTIVAILRGKKSENADEIDADINRIELFFRKNPALIHLQEVATGNTIPHFLAKIANVVEGSDPNSRAAQYDMLLQDLLTNHKPNPTIKNNLGLTVEDELQKNRNRVVGKRINAIDALTKKSTLADNELTELVYKVKLDPGLLIKPKPKDNNNTMLHDMAKQKISNEYDAADLAHNVLIHFLNQKGKVTNPFVRNGDNKMLGAGIGKTPIEIAIQNNNKPFLLGMQNAIQAALKIKGTAKTSKTGATINSWEIGDTKFDTQVKAQLFNAFLNINTVLGAYSEADLKVNAAQEEVKPARVKETQVETYLDLPPGTVKQTNVNFDNGISATVAEYLDEELTAEEKEKHMIDILDELLAIEDVASTVAYRPLEAIIDEDADVDDKVAVNDSPADLDKLFDEIQDSIDMSGLEIPEEAVAPQKPNGKHKGPNDFFDNKNQQTLSAKANEVKHQGVNHNQQLRQQFRPGGKK